MSMPRKAPATSREINIRRVFAAPRAAVYAAWTDPQQLPLWWGPNGFTATVHAMDVRPGGTWRMTMHGPDGRDYSNHIIYEVVEAPARLVYRFEPEPGAEPVHCTFTVTFAERGAETLVHLKMAFPDAKAREDNARAYHSVDGGVQHLARLAQQLGETDAAPKPQLEFTRDFAAPLKTVFAAWSEAEVLRQWWGPRGFTCPVCEFDATPGGAVVIHMQGPDGRVYPMSATVAEIEPPLRMVWVTEPLNASGDPMFSGRIEMKFEAQGERTRVTIQIQNLWASAEGAPFLAGAQAGWASMLDRLVERFAG